jgi:hypothetical protein
MESGLRNSVVIAAVGDVALLHRPSDGLFRSGWDDADLRIANISTSATPGGIDAAELEPLTADAVLTPGWL